MNKTLRFFVSMLCMVATPAMAAVSIKKAAPVATQQTSVQEGTGNLLGTALTLASGVMALTKQINALNTECQPTSSEQEFVNKMMKEWAKTGEKTADEVLQSLGVKECEGTTYADSVRHAMQFEDSSNICVDVFNDKKDDDGKVWQSFPKVGVAEYCPDGELTDCNSKQRRKTSNIYDLFDEITFSEADYTVDELKSYSKFKEKAEKCSGSKAAQEQKALWGNFVKDSIGNIGQKSSAASIMDAVSGVVGSGGGVGGLQSLTGFITNTVNK